MLVASCLREFDQSAIPPSLLGSLSQSHCLGNKEQRNAKRTTGSDLSLSSLSPASPDHHSHHPGFYRLGGASQIRAIRRSETDRFVLGYQSFTGEVALNPGRESAKLTAGGLDEISYVTRLIPATSFVIREDTFRRTSGGKTYLTEGERIWVKIARYKRYDKLGQGPRAKTPQDPDVWSPPWCMAPGRKNYRIWRWSGLTSRQS